MRPAGRGLFFNLMAYDLAERLEQVKRKNARLRCEAFVDYSPVVCGVPISPITLASYNRLVAFDNPFAVGGPIDSVAVAGFVWVHHGRFGQAAHRIRKRVMRQVARDLFPRFPNFNAFLLFAAQVPRMRWLRRFTVRTATARLATAESEIRRLMHEAIHDLPLSGSGDDEDAKRNTEQVPIALQAQLLNTFRRGLDLSYEETESMPLKRLVQLLREHLHHATGGKGLSLMSREEAAIWREHLDRKNPRPEVQNFSGARPDPK